MASSVKIERDKVVVRKLDPRYQNRLKYAESAAKEFVKSQEEFHAGVYLIRIDGSPLAMAQLIEEDANDIAKACAVKLRDMIQEKEEQIAKLQTDVAALKKDLAAISKTIATALNSEVDPILDEAKKLRAKIEKLIGPLHPLGFNRLQKDLRAALKK
jgi:septal ring factor EnvC (AmiA/AmiB activator)